LESRNVLLSTEDPQMLQSHLDESLRRAYAELHEKVAALLATYEDSEYVGQISCYTIRIIRDIRSELPKNPSLQAFGLSLVPSLHNTLAMTVSKASLEVFEQSFAKMRMAGRALWEGNPELPVQPSPDTFKFLHALVLAMGKIGADLWSPTAVRVLKQYLRAGLGQRWVAALEAEDKKASSQVNGNTTNGEVATKHEDSPKVIEHGRTKEVLTQTLFDILVLQSSLDSSEVSSEDELKALENTFESKLDLDPGSRKRLQQAAKEYWKRTSLLFGLLS